MINHIDEHERDGENFLACERPLQIVSRVAKFIRTHGFCDDIDWPLSLRLYKAVRKAYQSIKGKKYESDIYTPDSHMRDFITDNILYFAYKGEVFGVIRDKDRNKRLHEPTMLITSIECMAVDSKNKVRDFSVHDRIPLFHPSFKILPSKVRRNIGGMHVHPNTQAYFDELNKPLLTIDEIKAKIQASLDERGGDE